MLISVIYQGFPLLLLMAGVIRFNLISLGYIVFFLGYFVIGPLEPALKATRLMSHTSQHPVRIWKVSGMYWALFILYALAVCIGHVLFQILMSSESLKDNSTLRLIGFHSFKSSGEAVRSIVPDAVMLLLGSIVSIMVLRLSSKEKAGHASSGVFLLKAATFLSLLTAGISNPSLFHSIYFVFFSLFLVFWAFFPKSFGHGISKINPLVLVFVAGHLLFWYMYQISEFGNKFSTENAAYLGLWKVGKHVRRDLPKWTSLFAELILLICLSQFNRKRSEVLAVEGMYADMPSGEGAALLSVEQDEYKQKNVAAKQLLNKAIRTHGRKLCHLVMFFSAFTIPSWISLGLLGLLVISLCVRDTQFERMVGPILLYVCTSAILQYFFTIPYLLPTGEMLDLIGLPRHSNAPVRYLLIAYAPVLFFAGYSGLMKISAMDINQERLFHAVATGDHNLVERAIHQESPLIHSRLNGESTVMVAAAHGYFGMVRTLHAAGVELNVTDAAGNTALHLAYEHGNDEVVDYLLSCGASANIENEDGHIYNEVDRSLKTKVWSGIRLLYRLLESQFYRHADKISLIVLYLVGMQEVNFLHMGYLIFFLLFFSIPALARRIWVLLVVYCGAVLMLLYAWAVFLSDDNENEDNYDWASTLGLFKTSNMYKDLLLYYLVVLFSSLQLYIYRRLEEDADLIKRQEDQLRHGKLFQIKILNDFVQFLFTLYSSNGLFLAYLCLVLVGLYGHVTAFKMGYIVLFLISLFVHMFASTPLRILKNYFVFIVLYAALVLLLQYAFQFPQFRDWVRETYRSISARPKLSLEEIGLRKRANVATIWTLFPATIVFVFSVFQLRVLWSSNPTGASGRRRMENSRRADDSFESRKPLLNNVGVNGTAVVYSQLDGSDMEVVDSIEREAEAERGEDNWFVEQYEAFTDFLRAVLFLHSSKILSILVWIIISTVNSANIVNLVYLLMCLSFLPIAGGRLLWLPLSFYSTVIIFLRYGYQFKYNIDKYAGPQARWVGFANYHSDLYEHMCGDVLIVVFSCMQRVALRWWAGSAASSAMVQPWSMDQYHIDKQERDRKRQLKKERQEEYRSGQKRGEEEESFTETATQAYQETKWFLLNGWMRFKYFVLHFFSNFGCEVALTSLLITSFARSNILSILYICLYVGSYMFQGSQGVRKWWKSLTFVLLFTVVVQYFLSIGPYPFHGHTYPWSEMPLRFQRWYVLGGYKTVDINWDFFSLFFVALQMKYFEKQRGSDRVREAEEAMGIYEAANDDANMDIVVGDDPDAWYNNMWSDIRSRFYIVADKIILLFIFFAGTFHADLLSFGYVILAMGVLTSKKLLYGDPQGLGKQSKYFTEHVEEWRRIHHYNFFVLVVVILYQMPFFRPAFYKNPNVVRWEPLLGLNQYTANPEKSVAREAFSDLGALHSIIIFVLLDIQLIIFGSPSYLPVLDYYEENRRMSEFRAVESTRLRKQTRMQKLAEILKNRRNFTQKLREITNKVHSMMKESAIDDPFYDEEVWPTRWEKGEERDSLQNLSDSDDETDEKIALLDKGALTTYHVPEEEQDPEDVAEDQMDAVELEEKQAQEGFIKRTYKAMRRGLRHFFVAAIDVTLWMTVTVDEDTGMKINTTASIWSLSTVTLFYRWLLSNTQLISFFIYLINLLVNPSLVSIFIPVLIFVYALFEEPRAPKGFWLLALLYSASLVILKFMFQLNAFCVTAADHTYTFQPNPYCALSTSGYTTDHEIAPDWLIGIHKTADRRFYSFVVWDLLCMLSVVWHRTVMIHKGVWDIGEEVMGDPIIKQQAQFRAGDQVNSSSKALKDGSSGMRKRGKKGSNGEDEEDEKNQETLVVQKMKGWDADEDEDDADRDGGKENKVTSTLSGILTSIWEALPGHVQDYYLKLVPRNKHHIHLVKPGTDLYLWIFVVELFSAVYILLFYAQMATTSQSSISSSLSTNLFSGGMVFTLLTQVGIIILDRVFYLFRSLRWKIVFQYFTVGLWMSLMFFRWPTQAQISFSENGHLKFFFILKSIYFILSGIQVTFGYPTVEQTGFQYITRKPSIWRGYVFRTYRALPFVFELRSLLDWMSYESALDLWEALKLEDVYASMYLVQCDILYRKLHRRGSPQPGYTKIVNGLLVFLFLILIIFLPLLVFSSANPVTDQNNVLSTKISLSVVGPSGEYELLTISSMDVIKTIGTMEYGQMKRDRVIADDSQKSIQEISMVPFADNLWSISPPSLEELKKALSNPKVVIDMKLTYEFSRAGPPEQKTIEDFTIVPLSQRDQDKLANIITTASNDAVKLEKIIPKYLRLPATGTPQALTKLFLDAYVSIKHPSEGGEYWELYTINSQGTQEGVDFITISNPIFKNPLGFTGFTYSVVGLYSIVVLTIGRFVRLFFANLMIMIPYEDLHDVNDLVSWCEGIYIARYAHFFKKEERLYRRLIKVYRTPPLLTRITRRKDHAD